MDKAVVFKNGLPGKRLTFFAELKIILHVCVKDGGDGLRLFAVDSLPPASVGNCNRGHSRRFGESRTAHSQLFQLSGKIPLASGLDLSCAHVRGLQVLV